jgi:hypothetical protein
VKETMLGEVVVCEIGTGVVFGFGLGEISNDIPISLCL